MASSNFNLRGIPSEVMLQLKEEAEKLHTSVNLLILKFIEEGIGLPRKKKTYHDLDHLANSWSSEEEKLFQKHTADFQEIDPELWS